MRPALAHNPKRRVALRQFTVLAAGAALACIAHGEGPAVIRVHARKFTFTPDKITLKPVSYTHLTLPTNNPWCRSRWSPYH